tara:strand:- start:333 stop:1076 length:744 start_codon:yes stop_codon:yes gene_type:complete
MKIFVASSGRCGTGFLCSGFKRYTNISAFHEQNPVLVGSLLREANCSGLESLALQVKAKDISRNYSFYIDTAHQFMRGFYRYALAEMPNLKVLKLIRNPLEVAVSRINRKVVPGSSGWLGRYDDENNLIKIPKKKWEELSDFQKILLDWIEHEERFDRVKDSFSQIVYIDFKELTNNPDVTFKRIFDELKIKRYEIKETSLLNRNSNKKKSAYCLKQKSELEYLIKTLNTLGYSLSWLKSPYYKKVL